MFGKRRWPADSRTIAWAGAGAFILGVISSAHADVEAGKAKVAQLCAECHRTSDWSGESRAALEALIKDVVAGKVPHSKRALKLSDQEIADIAAYWSSVRK